MTGEAFSEPKRVLLLHSFGRDFAPWSEYARVIRERTERQSKEPIDIFEASLATARFPDGEEDPFIDYLRTLFAKNQLNLVIPLGAPAVSFLQRHRNELFPLSTPALFTAVEQRRIPRISVTDNDVVVAINNDLPGTIANILRVLPDTTNVAVVIGDFPIEKYWLEQMRAEFQRFEGRVRFTWFNELSFEEMLMRAAALPPRSAIFFALLSVDAAEELRTKKGRRWHDFTRSPTRLFLVIMTSFSAKGSWAVRSLS